MFEEAANYSHLRKKISRRNDHSMFRSAMDHVLKRFDSKNSISSPNGFRLVYYDFTRVDPLSHYL